MPTNTFLKLKEEKKKRVINAIKKEFERAPIAEMSIKNIVVDAKIARGSFYQYFESREDLVEYFIKEEIEKDKKVLAEFYHENNNDIFETVYKYLEIVTKREKENYNYYLNLAEYTAKYELEHLTTLKPEVIFGNLINKFKTEEDRSKFLTLIKILSEISHFEKISIFGGHETREAGLKNLKEKLDFLKLAYGTLVLKEE